MKTRKFYSYGHELNNVGDLRESQVSEGFDVLRQRAEEDGYLFIRDYLDREQVLSVREEISEEMSKRELLNSNYSNIELRCQENETVKFIPEVANNSDKVKELLYSGRLTSFYRIFMVRR